MKIFNVIFTYQMNTSRDRLTAASTVEANSSEDARDIIIGRWYNVRIKSVTENQPTKALPHSV